jgi:hypothetical protein
MLMKQLIDQFLLSFSLATRALWFAVLVALGLGRPAGARADAFTVEQWFLDVVVQDSSTSEHVSAGFRTVQNPFQDSHSVALASGLTTAAAEYDFSWFPDYGSFGIEASLQAEDTGGFHVGAVSRGLIYLEPTVDLTVLVSGAYSYDLPVGSLATDFSILVADAETYEIFFYDFQGDDTFLDPSASGTFTMEGEAVLPAGRTYLMDYTMDLDAYGSTGALATGSGWVNFQIIPEPATATLLLLPAAVLLLRRRTPRRYSGRSSTTLTV